MSLLLHLMLVGAGPVVDVRLEAQAGAHASEHAGMHVEDAGAPPCDTGHHHEFCLVRALQSVDTPPAGALLQSALDSSLRRPPSASSAEPRVAAALSALGPRAPPAA